MKKSIPWRQFKCSTSELRLDITLKCGQSFRWKLLPDLDNVYIGVLQSKLLLVTQDQSQVYYHCVNNNQCSKTEEELRDYFQLSVNLEKLYRDWSDSDPIFKKLSLDYEGIRILRQDPVENVFSFICSANNNISRISGMVEKMCSEYGEKVGEYQDTEYFAFPELESISGPRVEQKLRQLGFGYRAKYIQQSAQSILEKGGRDWLLSLRNMNYIEARKSLLELSGVGPKVADCILLMSCDQPGAVPVDTHMFNIAKQYLPHLNKTKTVTDRVYLEIGDHFRTLYGDHAGWAHPVLFSADLKHIQKSVENHNKKHEETSEDTSSNDEQPVKKKKRKSK